MKSKFLPLFALAVTAALVPVSPASADEPDQIALAMPDAISSTAQDNLAAEQANLATNANNDENVTCQYKPTSYAPVYQTDLGPAVVKAEDVAETPGIQCVSLDPLSNEYPVLLEVSFEWYDTSVYPRVWKPVDGTTVPCTTNSALRQAVFLACVNRQVYDVDAPGAHLNTIHRAKFDLQLPINLAPTYSEDPQPLLAIKACPTC